MSVSVGCDGNNHQIHIPWHLTHKWENTLSNNWSPTSLHYYCLQ